MLSKITLTDGGRRDFLEKLGIGGLGAYLAGLIGSESYAKVKPNLESVVVGTEYKSIQHAIDALPKQGGVVFIPTGEHEIKETIRMHPNITIVGSGEATILKLADEVNADLIELQDDASNVEISNLTLDGNKDRGNPNAIGIDTRHPTLKYYLTFKNLHVKNFGDKGIFVKPSYYVEVSNNIVENCMLGISFCVRHGIVSNNIIRNTVDAFIDCGGGSFDPYDVIIANNVGDTIVSNGLAIDIFGSAHDVIVANNILKNLKAGKGTVTDGISVHHWRFPEGPYYLDNVIISGNRIDKADRLGILVEYAKAAVTGNIVTNCDNDGISVWYASGTTVANNICLGNGTGIGLNEAPKEATRDIVVQGNNSRNNKFYGIFESDHSDYNIITNNNCRGNGKGGIKYVGKNSVVPNNIE